jgi:hypothetical protein
MVHCGYEPSAVNHTFGGVGGLFSTVKAMLFNRYANEAAGKGLAEESQKPHGPLAHLGLTVEGKPVAKESAAAGAA